MVLFSPDRYERFYCRRFAGFDVLAAIVTAASNCSTVPNESGSSASFSSIGFTCSLSLTDFGKIRLFGQFQQFLHLGF